MPASSGVLSPFRLLQAKQQATRFSQVLAPPRERGTMWSSVSFDGVESFRQYWQVLRSRARIPFRESILVRRGIRRYSRRRITAGTGRVRRPVRIVMPEVSSTAAIPFITDVKARFAEMMLIA